MGHLHHFGDTIMGALPLFTLPRSAANARPPPNGAIAAFRIAREAPPVHRNIAGTPLAVTKAEAMHQFFRTLTKKRQNPLSRNFVLIFQRAENLREF
jgi:hypothetical protein